MCERIDPDISHFILRACAVHITALSVGGGVPLAALAINFNTSMRSARPRGKNGIGITLRAYYARKIVLNNRRREFNL